MRVNTENKSMDIEPREINFVLDSLLVQYMFISRNQLPEVITFPTYQTAKTRWGEIRIQWVPDVSEIAKDIVEDGKHIPEVTPEQEAELDRRDDEIRDLRQKIAQLEAGKPEVVESDESVAEVKRPIAEMFESESPTPDDLPPTRPPMSEMLGQATPTPAPFRIGPDQPPVGRVPRMPAHPAEGGPDEMQTRSVGMDRLIPSDLILGDDLDEGAPEKPYDKVVKKDSEGGITIEEAEGDSPGH